ncbi:MAG: S8 family serine peptidase [Candidatus Hermodarchaeota archaeon]
MRVWRLFFQDRIIVLIILHVTILSNFYFYSAPHLQSQPEFKEIFLNSEFEMNIPKQNYPLYLERINQKANTKFQQIDDINVSFDSYYNQVNPPSVINAGLSGENITIAILDSGINTTPWLNSKNLISSHTTIPNSTLVTDDNGHGTSVASIISKIAPEASIISIKVSDESGYIKPEWIQEALELALKLNISIIHASVGSKYLNSLNSSIFTEISSRNISAIFAAGNDGPFGTSLNTPSIYTEPIAVGMAFNQTIVSPVSSSGPRPSGLLGPDIVAPGVNIPTYASEEKIVTPSGTSLAAPFVTGTIALLREAFPNESVTTLKAVLLETAKFMNKTSPIHQGNGFLDISKAYERLKIINSKPLFTFAPRKLSSDFSYFGHSVNGEERIYRIALYSTINSTLLSTNDSQISPIRISLENVNQKIKTGLNYLNLSLYIPENLRMDKREGNVTFNFTNGTIWSSNLTIKIENRYPGGNILFYQGYDDDSFVPSGPTGSYSHLQYYLEVIYGMNVAGAIRPGELTTVAGPLVFTHQISGRISRQDLENQDILVMADIELGISEEEIKIIQDWVSEGHSLLVLSYPSQIQEGNEILSNQSAINELLKPYGINIANDNTKPRFSRFEKAVLSDSNLIFEEKYDDLEFDYNGTNIIIFPESEAKILATATDVNSGISNIPVAGYWENTESNGKVVVFGSELPFNDLSFYSNQSFENLIVTTRIFHWMIQDQQIPLEILISSTPTIGTSTRIQVTIDSSAFSASHFNGTIIEANGSFSQIMFNQTNNMYLGSWKPLAAGEAILWLNIKIPGKASTNGLILINVISTSDSNLFFLILLGGFVLLGISYYFFASRQPQRRSPIEESISMALRKRKSTPKHAGLETLEICPRCQSSRFATESKYCFKCGKEL